MVYTIPVGKEHEALVSEWAYWEFKDYKYYLVVKDVVWRKLLYAARKTKDNKTILMHREIAGAEPGEIVHHVNANGLDNRDGNLMKTDARTNSGLRHHERTSQYPGVSYKGGELPWQADITIHGKTLYLERHPTELLAYEAYKKALRYWTAKSR